MLVCYTRANIDFNATTGKQHKGGQFYKSQNGSGKNGKNGDVSQFELLGVRKVGLVAFQKANCVCRFHIKIKL